MRDDKYNNLVFQFYLSLPLPARLLIPGIDLTLPLKHNHLDQFDPLYFGLDKCLLLIETLFFHLKSPHQMSERKGVE